jgi:hypothetical protein
MDAGRTPNRLSRETSPYLRGHQHNPVDWYPWGEEALRRARAEDKPIFLSIGYAACHWCHVMERESFENEGIAALMNERFVNIKVDREERPDVDEIYMAATQMLAGQGGWPNSVFLTPDLRPFFAGTYFAPEPRFGRPGFEQVLLAVSEAYGARRQEIDKVAGEVAARIRALSEAAPSSQLLTGSILNRAFGDLAARFDDRHGGFGGAPKFPHPLDLGFLLRYWRRTRNPEALRMAVLTLESMARGGIRDQLGGGFHRYAVDERWLVPHFEKMLYDNALLARAYLEAAVAVKDQPASPAVPAGGEATAAFFREEARDTLEWALREMAAPDGGFCSSLDADSEGEEGRFYVWTPAEIEQVLGREEAAVFCAVYGVTPQGNFENGRSVLHLERSPAEAAAERRAGDSDLRLRLASARGRLLRARERRAPPARDDKVLADWNALLIGALAGAARVLGEPRWIEAAKRTARFILDAMRPGGRLAHAHAGGQARHPALLTDYAGLVAACLDLYEATFDPTWVREARVLADRMIDRFRDPRQGGFFLTPADHEPLLGRVRESNDGATPSGAALAALALPRLAALTGEESYRRHAEDTLRLYRDRVERFPSAFGMMLCALDQHLDRQRQIVLAGRRDDPALRPFLDAVRGAYEPNTVVALAEPGRAGAGDAPLGLLEGKTMVDGRPAAYVCRDGACGPPRVSPSGLFD